MALGKKAKTAQVGIREMPKKQYCPAHDEACRAVMIMPGRHMRYNCPQGHQLTKQEVVLR